MARLSVVVCVIFTCAVSGAALPYRLTGQKVSLNPDITGTQQPDEILWKHNGNKVVEFNGRTQQVFGLFKNRVTLDWITADLTIEDLRPDDSGEYDVEVFIKNRLSRKTFQLEVLDEVSKPNITCERRKGSNSTDGQQATLTCSAESRQPQTLTYEWIPHGVGPRLTISLSDKNKEYICTVTNPLTSASAKFTAKDCYPDQGVPVLLIACLISVVLIIVIALVVGIVFCKKKNKACFTKDVDKAAGDGNDTASIDEGRRLIDRTPTVPSHQPLALLQSNSNKTPNDLERSDLDKELHKESVRNRVKQFESNPHISKLFQDAATGLNNNTNNSKKTISPPLAPGRKPSYEGSNKGDADHLKEPDSDSHQDIETEEAGLLDVVDRESYPAPEQPAPQKQTDEDVDVKSPPANKVTPPVPMPRMRQQQIPPVGAEDITDISVSNKTNSDNYQVFNPSIPKKTDQSKSGELQESPDATYSELDQQNQDNTRQDSPEKQLDSDMAKGKKGEDEGDTDGNEDKERRNKDTEEAKLEKQPDKERRDEDTEETTLEKQPDKKRRDGEDEDTEETTSEKQSDKETRDEDTEETTSEKQSDKERRDEDTEEKVT